MCTVSLYYKRRLGACSALLHAPQGQGCLTASTGDLMSLCVAHRIPLCPHVFLVVAFLLRSYYFD
jgi:hypothetical protein